MPYSDKDLDTLTEYREGIVSALLKANEAIHSLNEAIDETGADHPRVVPIPEERIAAVETTPFQNRDPFIAARAEVREHLDTDTTDGPRAIQSELEDYDERVKNAHGHLEKYLLKEDRAQKVEQ